MGERGRERGAKGKEQGGGQWADSPHPRHCLQPRLQPPLPQGLVLERILGAPAVPRPLHPSRSHPGRVASEVYVRTLVASSLRCSILVLFFLSASPVLQAEGGAGEIRGTGSCPNPLHPKGRGRQSRGRQPGHAARGQRQRAGVPWESLGENVSGEQGGPPGRAR